MRGTLLGATLGLQLGLGAAVIFGLGPLAIACIQATICAATAREKGGPSCVNSLSATSCHWMAITQGQGTTSWFCRWTKPSTPITPNGCVQPRHCCWDV